ncbi:Orn/Lys/Arg decarboxylase N-terminal domain-containing protein [Microbulbifer sp. MLAF003]|uniref:Orn/Lys/Arg family decarboxylase n=1 Tax=Microbulbifer sp. MLAF003 TaxID=3032582 RepID=UPI0024ACD211|nr:Orn/Lys/Arg decarboxylase N-terminal domain-containing protein [Microbulbifer sp. MLAF003]WHI52887.1 Orn/Lys/Arg decarboxylase N-terminal domain-containing protein [Microbulbifer sp. MLAF003]
MHKLGEKVPNSLLALLASGEIASNSAPGRAAARLEEELALRRIDLITTVSSDDASAMLRANPAIQCLLLNWELPGDGDYPALHVLEQLRARNLQLPVFLLADRETVGNMPRRALELANDFIWMLEDTPTFISGRIQGAIERYRQAVLPPMFSALTHFARVHEYSWHTPGHTGGTAFLKSPAGRAFYDFFGENMLRSDLSISVTELGSLLDHTGPIAAGEHYAAQVFGADRTYYVTNGSSTSNRVIVMASVTRGQLALCDRNCHKSVEHAITMSGAVPAYLVPLRNHYGLIGPIPPEQLTKGAVDQAIQENPLSKMADGQRAVHAVITNSTYDGLCYNVRRVEELLGESVDRLHFDEAWYAYARFNPIYRNRFAMYDSDDPEPNLKPTKFATQSTHKLLAALSQASMIHIRDGRSPIEHGRFNEAFMLHASTSPLYSIMASNDVSAAMMDGPGGTALTGESIAEAVAFRQVLARLKREYEDKGEWFFDGWQPDRVTDPSSGHNYAFHAAPAELLCKEVACWLLDPDESWHGFGNLEKNYCMLDPIKVSITTPGMQRNGELDKWGIPASIISKYLDNLGIIVEKTTDFTILFLFSIGITKGKWGTLVNALLAFKRDYDANHPISQCLPNLLKKHPTYGDIGLRDLADKMFAGMKKLRSTATMSAGFSALPGADCSPVQAYEALVRGDVEMLPLNQLAGRTAATGVTPYPPGIPLLMPGENFGTADSPALKYLQVLESFDREFPGFSHDNHGVEVRNGRYHIYALRPEVQP